MAVRARCILAALAPIAALLAAGPAAAAPQTHIVVIDKMKFGPAPANASVGDTIVWVNRDVFRHTATAKAGGFDVDLPPKTKAKTVLRKAGTFKLTCVYHPGMKGTLQVKGK